jgi:peptidoglycan/xylan/chitin deacetylase (PgdA/CDA1 family)
MIKKAVTVGIVLALLTVAIGGSIALTRPSWGEPADPTWNTYDSIVVFRNDDIQPDYRTEAMKAVNRIFIEEGVPVTHGVIPAVENNALTESGDVCSYLRGLERNHPRLFEFALHGYTHERLTEFYGGSEFGSLPYERQLKRIENGREILTDCLGHGTTTFIPPLDTYDSRTVRALDELGFTVVSGGHWFTKQYYGETGVFMEGGLVHAPNSKMFVENWTTGEFYSRSELRRSFDRALENHSIYVQSLHYTTFTTEERRERLRSLIEYMKSSGDLKFTTLGRLGDGLREGTIRRTDDGWKVLEPVRRSDDRRDSLGDRLADLFDGVVPAVLGRAEPAGTAVGDRERYAVPSTRDAASSA